MDFGSLKFNPLLFGITLKAIRNYLGVSQKYVADKLFVSQQYISYIESGICLPSSRILADIENFFIFYDVSYFEWLNFMFICQKRGIDINDCLPYKKGKFFEMIYLLGFTKV